MDLYGMIGKVRKNGTVVKCIPVFKDTSGRYYVRDGKDIKPIDISCYGTPLFLPASKKKIDDGKEYLFLFQPQKSLQWLQGRVGLDAQSVGIYNNSEFCVFPYTLNEKDMTRAYKVIMEKGGDIY